jgi:hypothetical protein
VSCDDACDLRSLVLIAVEAQSVWRSDEKNIVTVSKSRLAEYALD